VAAPSVQTDTTYFYQSVPQYIQDWDADNGYAFLLWLDGICSMIQNVDDFARDDLINGRVGWSDLFDYSIYENIDTSKPDWQATFAQALQVLPWLAQFVGTSLPQMPNLPTPESRVAAVNNWITQLTTFNGFQRGSVSAFLELFALYLTNINPTGATVTTSQFVVLEKTKVAYNPTLAYVTDPYSLVILVPANLIPNTSYAVIEATLAARFGHDGYDNYTSAYGNYAAIPNAITSVQTFVNQNAPAGLLVTILAS